MGLKIPPPLPADRVVLTREALGAGLDKQTIRRLVLKGEWRRVRHGAYCSAALWESCDDQGRRRLVHEAVYRQARTPLLLSHTTALDLLGVPVRRPVVAETTALGAAYLAGLAVGYWKDTGDVTRNWALDREFTPAMAPADRDRLYRGWAKAVSRSRDFAER